MKITLKEIFDIFRDINPLKQIMEKDIPAVVSFKLAKIYKVLGENFLLVKEQRDKLAKKYGEEKVIDKEKKIVKWVIKKEHIEKANNELNQILKEEIEIENIPLDIADLEIKLPPRDLIYLDKIFK